MGPGLLFPDSLSSLLFFKSVIKQIVLHLVVFRSEFPH